MLLPLVAAASAGCGGEDTTGSGGGTTITINRGTDQGVADGMQGKVTGIKQGSFTLSGCSSRSCRGVVKATPDEVNRSGKVVITP